MRQAISLTRPHADSYRPDLPLGRFTDGELLKTTKGDREYYAAHPITLHATTKADPRTKLLRSIADGKKVGTPARERAEKDLAAYVRPLERQQARVLSRLAELNITDARPSVPSSQPEQVQ